MNSKFGMLLLLASVLLSSPGALAGWKASNYPNPTQDVDKCGRNGVRSWVCDPDGVISYESANVVEGILKQIHAGRPPYALGPCGRAGPQGFQVAVALMRRMQFFGDAATAAKDFATALHDSWGVGDRRCDNGVVLLLSKKDRQLYISTGAGTTNILTYDVLGDILDDVRPLLRKQRYDEAVERAVVDIGLALAGRPVEPEPDRRDKFSKDDALGLAIFVVGAGGMLAVASWNHRRQSRRYNDCKSKLEKLKRDQAALRAGSPYNPTSCPVCLEDFAPEPNASGGNGSGAGGSAGGGASEAAAGAAAAEGPSGNTSGSAAGAAAAARATAAAAAASAASAPAAKEAGQDCKGCKHHGGQHSHDAEGEGELRKPLLGGSGSSVSGSGSDVGATAGSDAAPAAGSDGAAAQRRPLVLPCGHAFCEPCISKWLDQKKVTCPICRRPIDEEDSPADPRTGSSAQQPRQPPSQRTDAGGGAGSGSGSGSGPSRPPCSVDDQEDDSAAAAAATQTQDRRGWGFGTGGGWGVGFGAGTRTYGSPRLRLRWGGRRRGGMRMHEDLLMAEMMFRLRQLQRQHPDFISDSMVNSWQEDLRAGREFSASQLRDFQLRDPANRSALASSGRSGTGISFGGGSSRGGGGRGGSW